MTHRIPIDCKHITHRRWFKIKRSALRLKRGIGRFLHLIAKEPLTDAGILWVSYFTLVIIVIAWALGYVEAILSWMR